ncbi:MAG: ribokinase [Rhodobacteraceae bacterium]|nr:ribokinase [Paracoccaceae bacterium]
MIFNLGSINIDMVYQVPHFPAPGETLHSKDFTKGLGGKGANMSIAIAKAGGAVKHIGAVGKDGVWLRELLGEAGVDTGFVEVLDMPTGHAVINVDDAGENTIVLYSGANMALQKSRIKAALAGASAGDWLLLQNETSLGVFAAKIAREKHMKIAYAAAPFEASAIAELIDKVDLIAVNEVEAAALSTMADGVEKLLITKGAKGIRYRDSGAEYTQDVFKVKPVDTTGAGDTYLGYFLAGIDMGMAPQTALRRAAAASSLQITRLGAAAAIPELAEVKAFLSD